MATKIFKPTTVTSTFAYLEKLAHSDRNMVFRGHKYSSWRLESTLARHTNAGYTRLAIMGMDEMLDEFYTRLASIGKLPEKKMSARTRLEYARHHGVPSPLIDFSYSPYIALWMAFNGVRPAKDSAAVYALNLNGLGILWQKHTKDNSAFDQFRWNRSKLFEDKFPVNTLQAVLFPASCNTRMQRQMGLFIYDSIQYNQGSYKDLEDFIGKGNDPTYDGNSTFTLHKVIIPHRIVSDVFNRLDLMGIDGTRLYDNHEGAVADVKNGYVYESRAGIAHDLNNSDRDPWA